MDTIYLKLTITEDDTLTNKIRDEGLLFENISDAVCLDRDAIEEIDETNYSVVTDEIKNNFVRLTSERAAKS